MPERFVEEILGVSDFREKEKVFTLLKALLAEFFGTFLLNFFGCGSIIAMRSSPGSSILFPAFTFGLIVFAVVQALGHVSGAHINPAVTFAMMCVLQITIIKGLLYVIVQFIGCTSGTAALKQFTPVNWSQPWHTTENWGVTKLDPAVTVLQGLGIEFYLAFILVMVVCAVSDPLRPETKPIGPLCIGLTVTMCLIMGIPYTGASINPARTLGSAVMSSFYENIWLYFVGPILGGILAAIIYKFAFSVHKPAETTEP